MIENISPDKKPCPDCGGERVWADTTVTDGVAVKPLNSLGLTTATALQPLVCTGCGLTTWYHPQPLKAVKKRPDKPIKR